MKRYEIILNSIISRNQELDNEMRILLKNWENVLKKCINSESASRSDNTKVLILNNSDVLEHLRAKRSEGSTADERNGGKKKNRNNRTRSIGII